MKNAVDRLPVIVPTDGVSLEGDLQPSSQSLGVVGFAHGSGSGRHSPRNRMVADVLAGAGLGTLLIDLLSAEEEIADRRTGALRFDIGLLGGRVTSMVDWLSQDERTSALPVGLFGASTGAAAALVAAAERPERVRAVVSRGGRPDLAGAALTTARAPTLLIVGGADASVIELNREAMRAMRCEHRLEIVPGAGHLFEQPGALERVAQLARDWFRAHLPG